MPMRIARGIIASVIGALVSMFVERAWKRHKQKQKQREDRS